jgi:hypothetical protein
MSKRPAQSAFSLLALVLALAAGGLAGALLGRGNPSLRATAAPAKLEPVIALEERDADPAEAAPRPEAPAQADSAKDGPAARELYDKIAKLDNELFEAFNTCKLDKFHELIAEDVEFYHDKGGLTSGRTKFIETVTKRCEDLANKSQRSRRELVAGSLEVYPMNNYGAVQVGTHRFYMTDRGRKEQLVQVAKFVHLWQNKGGEWRVTRALSFDHKDPKE